MGFAEKLLAARDARAQRQFAMREKYGMPVVSFTMNIAGAEKDSPLIREGFAIGCERIMGQLKRLQAACVEQSVLREDTGCEALFAVDADAAALKRAAVLLEEDDELGRLFDIDVIAADGRGVGRSALGMQPRRCLLCGSAAKECARARTHTAEALKERTENILQCAVREETCRTIAANATRALLYEVCTTPKPGLVDRANNGSHRDMDIFTFMDSASVLQPWFFRCAQIGQETRVQAPEEAFALLRAPGMLAEGTMLGATKGVNTHKGAIFTLGIVCAALGRLERQQRKEPKLVLRECAAMTQGLVETDMNGVTAETARTQGERLYALYGITGIRGQLEKGLPAVGEHGLRVLEQGLEAGKSRDEAGAAALLAMMAVAEDTNMLKRGGVEAAAAKAAELREYLTRQPYPDLDWMRALDAEYIAENLSAGGCADLLAVCWLLHFVKSGE